MTPREIDTLIRMRAEGRPFKEISALLGRTIETLHCAAFKAKITQTNHGFWTPTKIDLLKHLAEKHDRSETEIGQELKCSRNAVIGKAGRLGISLRAPDRLAWRPMRKSRPRPPKAVLRPIKINAIEQAVFEIAPEPTQATWISFADIEGDACRWPVEGEPGPRMMCCGATQIVGSSYCGHHYGRAHIGGAR